MGGLQHREGVKRGWRGGEGGIVVAVAVVVVVVVANSAIELDVIVKSHMYKDQVKDRRTGRQSPRCQARTCYLPDMGSHTRLGETDPIYQIGM